MEIKKETKIADVVAKNYKTSEVFSKYKIDFCCHWHIPLGEACEKNNIDFEEIKIDIENMLNSRNSWAILDLSTWPLDLIIDYIEKKHHNYIDSNTPDITFYLDKIARVHGERHPELIEIAESFKNSSKLLHPHMREEESEIFPIIKKVVANTASLEEIQKLPKLIEIKKKEHDIEWERFTHLSDITNHYEVPSDGCNTYKVAFEMLHEFHEDLLFHVHVENNILFPKVLEIIK